ncbi:MAG: penicillin-binding protein, partial [Alphaproteobacteria bacterium]|nr:penicillin-binding protein [Alphaproteobacteria bacterium]
ALIERIQDKNGKTVYARDARPCDGCTFASVTDASASSPPIPPDLREQVLDSAVAYQMTSILEGAVQRGTGTRAKVLERPIAGKTGTTNDSNDTWFIGFSPNLVCGVYVGFDKPKTLGPKETGASVALPAFVSFMKDALKDTPPVPFRVPPEVQLVKVDYESGQATSGQPDGKHIIMEAFRATNFDTAATGEATGGEEGAAPLGALDESAALNLPIGGGENAAPPPLPQDNAGTALPLPEGGGVPGQWRGPVTRSKGQVVDVPSGTGGLY